MDSLRIIALCCWAVVPQLAGCSGSDPAQPPREDAAVAAGDQGPSALDQAVAPGPDADLTVFRVAAVQYSSGDFALVQGCSDDLCGVSHFLRQAADNGAHLAVLPELAIDQAEVELTPAPEDRPAADSRWQPGSILATLARLADEENLTVVVHLLTQDNPGPSADLYSTSVALDGSGTALAAHHKYELFGESLAVGTSLDTSFFDTPAGRAGLMICADVHCLITDLGIGVNICLTPEAIAMTKEYFLEHQPEIVLFSSLWTIPASQPIWGTIDALKKLAEAANVWVVAANNTRSAGYGGGIVRPGGEPLELVVDTKPSVVYGDLPLKN